MIQSFEVDGPYYVEYEEAINHTQVTEPRENQVTESQEKENPAVSKLREAFDTARNAIIEGSELAKLVAELRESVQGLSAEVASLRNDLDYARNRNRELDEQVTSVRASRDQALSELAQMRDRAIGAEAERDSNINSVKSLEAEVDAVYGRLQEAHKARDDAQYRTVELEDKLKAAEAKLAKFEALMGEVFKHEAPPTPANDNQPRAETGQFRPYGDSGSQGSY